MKLKDTEKAYQVGDPSIRIFNRLGREILGGGVKSISHFGIVRDYEIHLIGGGEIWLPHNVLKLIFEHEKAEKIDLLALEP